MGPPVFCSRIQHTRVHLYLGGIIFDNTNPTALPKIVVARMSHYIA